MGKFLKYGAVGLIGFVVLCLMFPGQPKVATADEQAQFAREKSEFKARMASMHFQSNPTILCAAKRVSDETVRTTYLLWIHERADLTTKHQRDNASFDTVTSIEACGGSMSALVHEMQNDNDNLVFKGLAAAMLEAGR